MTQISPEAATRREQARDDHGRFGPSAAAEADLSTIVLDQDADPRAGDWYDPDTGGAADEDERAQRVYDALDELDEQASEAYERNYQDETSRLHHGRIALAKVFRASHPHVKELHLAEEPQGVYIDHATGHDGQRVDIRDGWPEQADLDQVNRNVSDLVASPVGGALEHSFPRRGRYIVVDIDETLHDEAAAPF